MTGSWLPVTTQEKGIGFVLGSLLQTHAQHLFKKKLKIIMEKE